MPWLELAVGAYFAWTVWYAITTENYFTVPFLVLFVFGYWYTAAAEPAARAVRARGQEPAGPRCMRSRIRWGFSERYSSLTFG